MANLFTRLTTFQPRRVIKSEDANALQIALEAVFNLLGTAPPTGKNGVSTPFWVGDATESGHAVTKAQLDASPASATAAAASATAAATSETNAATSETNAATSASAAATSATASATSATASATSAASIGSAETNSAASASAASTSETNAATSASAASTSETNAATSATNAATSASAASTSASAASTSASGASTSASAASTSASEAAASAAVIDLTAPGPIGGTTSDTGDFTSINASTGDISDANNSGTSLRVHKTGTAGLALSVESDSVTNVAAQVVSPAANFAQKVENTHATTPYGLYINFSGASPDDRVQDFLRAEDSTGVKYNLWSDGGISAAGNTIIGSTIVEPDGTIHAYSGSAGTVTASAAADDGVFENNGPVGISLLYTDTAADNYGNIYWGDPTDGSADGRISYFGSSYVVAADRQTMKFRAGGVLQAAMSGGAGSETLKLEGGLSLSGATPTAGGGIAFPATQVASADANTLDGYEEGDFTPAIFYQNGTDLGNATNTVQLGRYQKVGNKVTVWVELSWTITGSPANDNVGCSGFPFTAISDTIDYVGTGYIANADTNLTDGLVPELSTGAATAVFTNGAGDANLGNEIGATGTKTAKFTLSYRV